MPPLFILTGGLVGAIGSGLTAVGATSAGATLAGLGSGIAGVAGSGAAASGVAAGASSWLSPLWTAAQIGGLGISALGQYQSGQAEAKAMEANARNAEIEARSIQESGKSQELQLSRQRRQMIGTQATMFGGAGVDLGSGSPLEVMAQTARNYEEDLQNLGYNTDLSAASKNYQASIYDWSARQRRSAGLVNSMGTILGGLGMVGRSNRFGGLLLGKEKTGWSLLE